ncbi:uncharacterized protein V6R79_004207 [Siganus canaliculatus]
MKRKQLQAEFSLSSSSSSSIALKTEYDQSSPEHEAASLGSECDQLLDLSSFPKDCHCDWPDLAALSEPSVLPGVKVEADIGEYRLDGKMAEGEIDEEDIPSFLSHMESHGGNVYSLDDSGALSSSKAPSSTFGLPGIPVQLAALTSHENMGLLVALEKQRLELERQRLAVETERLSVEKERLRLAEVKRERLQVDRERLQVEKERLRLLHLSQSEHVGSSFDLLPQQSPPSSSTSSLTWTQDGQREKGWVSLEAERLKLEKERLQLEKERMQFFKFEAGRLQIERERLQVEKERMQLQKDHQGHLE